MAEKISGIYKITNTVTNDFYIGSSKNVKRRWAAHKQPSRWKQYPNNPMYQDMKKFGLNNFVFQILAEVEVESLKEIEQQFIEKMHPAYNNINAKGLDIERKKESHRKYKKEYQKSNKGKESNRKSCNKYDNQLCYYNGETLTLCALRNRFQRAGVEHSTIEAKKYLLVNSKDNICTALEV